MESGGSPETKGTWLCESIEGNQQTTLIEDEQAESLFYLEQRRRRRLAVLWGKSDFKTGQSRMARLCRISAH